MISSRLDYCNALLYGVSKYNVDKLQKIQNAAARLVACKRRHDYISPTLFTLHWLPVQYRIHYKILLLTFKALHDMSPLYVKNMLHFYVPERCLRSSSSLYLQVPRTKLATAGDISFSVAAPKLWNSLPSDIRNCEVLSSFKSKLKTHLFSIAFTQD